MAAPFSWRFDGRGALVIGAGRGLGLAYARRLAAYGAAVAVNDADEQAANSAADSIARAGGSALAVIGGTSSVESIQDIIARSTAALGRLDIVVQDHASGCAEGHLLKLTDEALVAAVNRHLLATMRVTRAAITHMAKSGSGRVVATASGIGAFGLAGSSPCAAATAGIAGFVKSVALEIAATDIRINAIAPIAQTPQADAVFRAAPLVEVDRYAIDAVVPAVAYLCHDACRLNGELLSAAAGRVARIFTSTVAGYFNPDADHAEIGANIEQIMATNHAVLPRSATDELMLIEV